MSQLPSIYPERNFVSSFPGIPWETLHAGPRCSYSFTALQGSVSVHCFMPTSLTPGLPEVGARHQPWPGSRKDTQKLFPRLGFCPHNTDRRCVAWNLLTGLASDERLH